MGEIADMMGDGTLCAGCGMLMEDEDAPGGFPRYCHDCDKEQRKEHSRRSASNDFGKCRQLAQSGGLRLVRCTDTQYQLFGPGEKGWLINIYPGNRRLYFDRNRPKAPYLHVRMGEWTLHDVVTAAIEATKETR